MLVGCTATKLKAMLTPASKRKGKGGRKPAVDPRLIPGTDIRKARRLLANRLSAARSSMKQKNQIEVGPPHSSLFLLKAGLRPLPLSWVALRSFSACF